MARYPVPQATPSGAVAGPQVYFILEPSTPLEFLPDRNPLQGLEAIPSGAVDDPRLYFRLTPAPDLLLDVFAPFRAKEVVVSGVVNKARLYFDLARAGADWYPRIRRRRR